jgi:hypothetical membrane protein
MDVEEEVQDLKSHAENMQTTIGVMMLEKQIAMLMGVFSDGTKPRHAKLIQQYINNQTAWLNR